MCVLSTAHLRRCSCAAIYRCPCAQRTPIQLCACWGVNNGIVGLWMRVLSAAHLRNLCSVWLLCGAFVWCVCGGRFVAIRSLYWLYQLYCARFKESTFFTCMTIQSVRQTARLCRLSEAAFPSRLRNTFRSRLSASSLIAIALCGRESIAVTKFHPIESAASLAGL